MTCSPSAAAPPDFARMWGVGWRRYFFPGFWLVYLGQAIDGVSKHAHGAGAVLGYVIVAAFAVCYLAALPMGWRGSGRVFWALYAVACLLTAAEAPFAHQDALVFCVYIAVLTVASRSRFAASMVIVLTLATMFIPRLVSSWDGKIDWSGGLTVFLVSFAMFGFFMIVRSNIELTAARSEVARLAAENERGRIARDLHDLLGHSLTTITVKAGLARKLAERGESERAGTEIAEVEKLSRRTLGDVRAAVAGHREVTLAGELATAREVMRAAIIEAELPGSVDIADPALSELFGWIVREGVTNVVRHSHGRHCRIALGQRWIEITDDGDAGAAKAIGNGLAGLRERVHAFGGTVQSGPTGRGWRLRVDVPAPANEPADVPSAVGVTSA